ncbi:hypothetical protein O9993_02345 [Vibrio lentus]|nr:hypothetical protein [Vibrio lentus]
MSFRYRWNGQAGSQQANVANQDNGLTSILKSQKLLVVRRFSTDR